jgi:hypothetical protein
MQVEPLLSHSHRYLKSESIPQILRWRLVAMKDPSGRAGGRCDALEGASYHRWLMD